VLRSWLFTSNRRGIGATLGSHLSFTLSSFANLVWRRERFDVLIASSPPFLPQVSGALLAGLHATPLVIEIRDLWPDYLLALGMLKAGLASRAIFSLERWLLSRAEATVVVTESFRGRVIEKGVPADEVHVIPNGVDLTRYFRDDTEPEQPAFRRRDGEPIIGYLGTFGRGQALTTVVEAASALERRGVKARVLLVGDGPDKPNIVAAIARLGVTTVEIHPPIPRDSTRSFYNACDVCLVPLAPVDLFQETIPSKIFEVMACERPLVASLSGEGARIIEESQGGACTPPGDAAAIAAAIEQLLARGPEEREAMGKAARAYVSAHYDRRKLADQYYALLRTLSKRD
jgi:glycosyltransferase involved in cell wall biosynthesis